jgi:hypothetical protein
MTHTATENMNKAARGYAAAKEAELTSPPRLPGNEYNCSEDGCSSTEKIRGCHQPPSGRTSRGSETNQPVSKTE